LTSQLTMYQFNSYSNDLVISITSAIWFPKLVSDLILLQN